MNTYTFWHLGASWGGHDTSPKWEYTNAISYVCSSDPRNYHEKTDPYADGYAFREQKDTNPYSKTFGDTRLVEYPAWDDKCKGQTDTSPTWEYIDSSSYSCSSSSSSYREKSDIYADGYAFRKQKDTNPDSATYGNTKWVRYSEWDSKCKGQVDDRPKWEYIDSSSYGCSSSSSSYKAKSDIYADGYAFRQQKDTNPDSDTYGDTKWVRYSSWNSKCKGQVDDRPKWEYVDSTSYNCSSSSSSYKEKSDPYADGYAFRQQKDTNPDSDTYGDTKWVRYSSWDSKCVGEERPYQPTYTFTAEDYDVTGDSSIDITSYKTVKEGETTHVQWTVDEITGNGAEFIEKAVSADGNTSLTIKIKEGVYVGKHKAVITLRLNESGKTIEINVTIPDGGHVEPPVSNDMFAPCDRKYTYDLNCDFRPINIPICSVYNNQSAKPMVHGYEGRFFDYVRIEEGAGLVIGWSSEAIKSTEDFSTAIILQQEGSGKEFEIRFNVTPCLPVAPPTPPPPAL